MIVRQVANIPNADGDFVAKGVLHFGDLNVITHHDANSGALANKFRKDGSSNTCRATSYERGLPIKHFSQRNLLLLFLKV